jgi:hypothetical protein
MFSFSLMMFFFPCGGVVFLIGNVLMVVPNMGGLSMWNTQFVSSWFVVHCCIYSFMLLLFFHGLAPQLFFCLVQMWHLVWELLFIASTSKTIFHCWFFYWFFCSNN